MGPGSFHLVTLPSQGCHPHLRGQGWVPAVAVFTFLQEWGKTGSEGKTISFQANNVEVAHTFSVTSHWLEQNQRATSRP